MSARLTLIAAVAKNGVIGNSNALPWHLPEDLRHFKALTSGHAVIMGRKTWESLPARFRPLPGRRNIVVTRDPGYAAEGATVVHSLQEAIQVGAGPSQADAGSPPLGVGGSEPLLRAWGDNIVGVTEGNPFFGTGGTAPHGGPGVDLYVIGGAELYAHALPLAQRLELTELDADFMGDVFFPEFDPADWRETARTKQRAEAGFDFAFVSYARR